MKSQEIRSQFLKFFSDKGYTQKHSYSLVPANDPTLLFTNAGMVPFKGAFLGTEVNDFTKACTAQKCVRAGGKHNDLEQVGFTARHHTFFEMLGNFVFKDASKEAAIQEAWGLLTAIYKIPADRLIVTVYYDDKEARSIWENVIGLASDRVIDCGEKDNFWSMGDVGPCGPCTEIFYDHGPEVPGGMPGTPDEDGDRYVEIWNLVFMQYEMKADGSRVNLPSLGLDTGMGLERLCAVLQDVHNNFETDLFMPIISTLENKGVDLTTSRVIADHIRSCVFLIADGVYPSNEGRGYVLRRIMRRAIGFAYNAGVKNQFFAELSDVVYDIYATSYPDLNEKRDVIYKVIADEEGRFATTIKQGMALLEQLLSDSKKIISGLDAFKLYDTYGFPLDMTKKIALARGFSVDKEAYKVHMQEQKERSKSNAQFSAHIGGLDIDLETKFLGYQREENDAQILKLYIDSEPVKQLKSDDKAIIFVNESSFYPEGGGQVGDQGVIQGPYGQFIVQDTQKFNQAIGHIGYVASGTLSPGEDVALRIDHARKETAKNHTATHLLHAALRSILGKHVLQKGSLVAPERLRFDFAHPSPMTRDEIAKVEQIVNQQIQQNIPQTEQWMSLEDAKKQGVMALFDEKYADTVRVMQFGSISTELCGGLHVSATGSIGLFVIIQETGIASGIRRIEALSGQAAYHWMQSMRSERSKLNGLFKANSDTLVNKAQQTIQDLKKVRKQESKLLQKVYTLESASWLQRAHPLKHGQAIIQVLDGLDITTLRSISGALKSKANQTVLILLSKNQGQTQVFMSSFNTEYSCAKIFNQLIDQFGGKGGGKPKQAQGVLNISVEPSIEEDIISWIETSHGQG
ncbi:alanine--tRNA ligase [Candidatus Comchoanobacter bicostacola]|uniref:Alanine--tRNA ligase n=1 Tax=Candidatus Comchoanobacter bicostacola TaxID=2919598 RepID=A0ABY5DJX3_9GAMM|nr:alanine--tRNA ligase [Candidatus Comchoanobacter bicostacola]UTC24102.1 alanine--tRNA ligase [Candidatus Comchoanobacter bicostacola]